MVKLRLTAAQYADCWRERIEEEQATLAEQVQEKRSQQSAAEQGKKDREAAAAAAAAAKAAAPAAAPPSAAPSEVASVAPSRAPSRAPSVAPSRAPSVAASVLSDNESVVSSRMSGSTTYQLDKIERLEKKLAQEQVRRRALEEQLVRTKQQPLIG